MTQNRVRNVTKLRLKTDLILDLNKSMPKIIINQMKIGLKLHENFMVSLAVVALIGLTDTFEITGEKYRSNFARVLIDSRCFINFSYCRSGY